MEISTEVVGTVVRPAHACNSLKFEFLVGDLLKTSQ